MVTRILSFDIPNAFIKDLSENSSLIAGSMSFGFGIAMTAIEQVSRQNSYVFDGDRQKRINTMVSIHFAFLFATIISSTIANRYDNAAFVALSAVGLGGAFWSLRQILQINTTRLDGNEKAEIEFAAKRTLVGLGAMIGAPCAIVGKLALSYYTSQRV